MAKERQHIKTARPKFEFTWGITPIPDASATSIDGLPLSPFPPDKSLKAIAERIGRAFPNRPEYRESFAPFFDQHLTGKKLNGPGILLALRLAFQDWENAHPHWGPDCGTQFFEDMADSLITNFVDDVTVREAAQNALERYFRKRFRAHFKTS